MQQQIVRETFHLVSKRDDSVCNFLEGGTELGILDLIQVFVETLDKCFENVCELDLIFHVDKVHSLLSEIVVGGLVSETNSLEMIHHYKEQEKEDQVHYILSEMVMGGMVLETNMTEILTRVNEQDRIEKEEAGITAAPARAVSAVKEMNLPQKIKDMKLPELPSIGGLKF